METVDVVIVGAGLAGLSVGISDPDRATGSRAPGHADLGTC
ncbi:hypothetical protein FMEAI12_3380027 [Parafrankia sp. Ea1.12]|nr:hypothetical protein [Parafrankia sp. Ea1.12]SQD95921.1 hypothetical protein FMEAI12_3380027 [Parafrankia sp. Ea1.12]